MLDIVTACNTFAVSASLDGLLESMKTTVLPQTAESIAAYLAYALYLGLIVAGGLVAVLARNLVRALMGLVVTFLGVAGMYLLMASPFMAFMQLLIYIGAICVLIFFAIMLMKNTKGGEEFELPGILQLLYGLAAAAAPVLLFGPVIAMHAAKLSRPDIIAKETPIAELGMRLLEDFVLPFEIISVVLFVAMAGGVLLAWKKRPVRDSKGPSA